MKLSENAIRNITLFENLSGAKIKDCFEEEGILTFVVEEGNVKKALGFNNKNLRKMEHLLKKKIRVIAFSNDPERFINNLLYPVKAEKVEILDKIVYIKASDTITKGKIFGRSKENLRKLTAIIKKYFDIEELKVV